MSGLAGWPATAIPGRSSLGWCMRRLLARSGSMPPEIRHPPSSCDRFDVRRWPAASRPEEIAEGGEGSGPPILPSCPGWIRAAGTTGDGLCLGALGRRGTGDDKRRDGSSFPSPVPLCVLCGYEFTTEDTEGRRGGFFSRATGAAGDFFLIVMLRLDRSIQGSREWPSPGDDKGGGGSSSVGGAGVGVGGIEPRFSRLLRLCRGRRGVMGRG